uniref:HSF-type DNA-binding domain-containing protein n=1 Tax=Branchiostoma floridae TaxID=7739 RepID=C3YLJ4_BRAFL|eukprot:XP_002602919.1 hypothetical protein BRAFLDRAFT_98078 [Branchiostoma floridae]
MEGGGDEVPPSPFRSSGPLFPVRLRELADDPTVRSVRWSPDGTTLLIHQKLLEEELLDPEKPGAFKTRTFGSFYRQMNLYGFRRARGNREGRPEHPDGLETAELREFHHTYFQRDQPELLSLVRRPSCSRAALTERRTERVRQLQEASPQDRVERARWLQGESPRDRAERARLLQEASPRDRVERARWPQGESPRDRAERVRQLQEASPLDRVERARWPQGESPRDRAERVRQLQEASPQDRVERVRWPQGESPRDRVERVRQLQEASPQDRVERARWLQGESPQGKRTVSDLVQDERQRTPEGGTTCTDKSTPEDRPSMPVIPPTASPALAVPVTISAPTISTAPEGILYDTFVSPGTDTIYQSLWTSNLLSGADQGPLFSGPRASSLVQPQEFSLRPRVPGPRRNLFGTAAAATYHMIPGIANAARTDQQIPGTAGDATAYQQIPVTVGPATANQQIPGTASPAIANQQISGTAGPAIANQQISGTAGPAIANQKIPRTVDGATASQHIPVKVGAATANQQQILRIVGQAGDLTGQQIPGTVDVAATSNQEIPVCGTSISNQPIPVIIGSGRFQSNPSTRVEGKQLQAKVRPEGELRLEVPRLDLEVPLIEVPRSKVPCIDVSSVGVPRQDVPQVMAPYIKVPLSEVPLAEVPQCDNVPLVEEQQTKRSRTKASLEELPAGLSLIEVVWMPSPQTEEPQTKAQEVKMFSLKEPTSVPTVQLQRIASPWMEVPRIEVDTPLGMDHVLHKVIPLEGVSKVDVSLAEAAQKSLPTQLPAQPAVPAIGAGMSQCQRELSRQEVSDRTVPHMEAPNIKALPVSALVPQPVPTSVLQSAVPPTCRPLQSQTDQHAQEDAPVEVGVCARCRSKYGPPSEQTDTANPTAENGPSSEKSDGTNPTAEAMTSTAEIKANIVVSETKVPEIYTPSPARNEPSLPEVFVPPPARNASSPATGELQVPILKTPGKLADSSSHVSTATDYSTDPVVMVPASADNVAMATTDEVSFLTVANFEEVVTSPSKRQKAHDERDSLADKTSYKAAVSPAGQKATHTCLEEDIFFSPEDMSGTSTPKRKSRRRCKKLGGRERRGVRRKVQVMTHEEEVLAAVRAIQQEELEHGQVEVPAVSVLQHDMPRTLHDMPRTLHDMPRTLHDMSRPQCDKPRPQHDMSRPHHDMSRPQSDMPRPQHDIPIPQPETPLSLHDMPRTPFHVRRTPHDFSRPQQEMPRPLHDMPPKMPSSGFSNPPVPTAPFPASYAGLAPEDAKKLPFKKRFCAIPAEPAAQEPHEQGALSTSVDDLIVFGTSIRLVPAPEDSGSIFSNNHTSGLEEEDGLKTPEVDTKSSPYVVQGQFYVPLNEVECGEGNKDFEIVDIVGVDSKVAAEQSARDERSVVLGDEVQVQTLQEQQGQGHVGQPSDPDMQSAVPLISASRGDVVIV